MNICYFLQLSIQPSILKGRGVATEETHREVFEVALSDAQAKTSPSRACLSHLSIGYREHRWAHGRRRCQHLIEGYHLL